MTGSDFRTKPQSVNSWDLGGLSAKKFAKRVYEGVNEDDLLDKASALAFNLILAVFPLLLFILAMLGIFASHRSEFRTHLFGFLTDVLPFAASQALIHSLQEIPANAGGAKLTGGILLALWFASGGVTSMISGLNGVYRVKESRSFVKVRLIALGLTAAISVLVSLALAFVLGGGYIANKLGSYFGLHDVALFLWGSVQVLLALALVNLSFSLAYYFGPDFGRRRWQWISPGALVGIVLWLAASFAFRAYLHFFNSYSQTYGSLGSTMILLMWLYIAGFSFLLGGEINAQIEEAAMRDNGAAREG